jgi:hypothetical protein
MAADKCGAQRRLLASEWLVCCCCGHSVPMAIVEWRWLLLWFPPLSAGAEQRRSDAPATYENLLQRVGVFLEELEDTWGT